MLNTSSVADAKAAIADVKSHVAQGNQLGSFQVKDLGFLQIQGDDCRLDWLHLSKVPLNNMGGMHTKTTHSSKFLAILEYIIVKFLIAVKHTTNQF